MVEIDKVIMKLFNHHFWPMTSRRNNEPACVVVLEEIQKTHTLVPNEEYEKLKEKAKYWDAHEDSKAVSDSDNEHRAYLLFNNEVTEILVDALFKYMHGEDKIINPTPTTSMPVSVLKYQTDPLFHAQVDALRAKIIITAQNHCILRAGNHS